MPVLNSAGNGLSIGWQQNTKKFEEVLEEHAAHLYYQIRFDLLQPQIRVWTSAWFFIQRRDQRESDFQDEQLIKEWVTLSATPNP